MENKDNAGNNLVNPDDINTEINEKSTNEDAINENNINDIDFFNPVREFENLQPIVEEKRGMRIVPIILIFVILIIVILVISSIVNKKKDSVCVPIEDKVIREAFKYASENSLLPINGGENVVIDLNTLYSENILNQSEISVNSKICNGSVKITKYKDDYIKTIDLNSCNYCSTDKRYKKWSNETTKEPKGNNMVVDVNAYYNYYTYEDYSSSSTVYLNSSLINKEVSEKYGVALPVDMEKLPKIPNDAEIIKIIKSDKKYYRYRDQKWMFYIDNGGSYTNYFSSEKPAGYSYKDDKTLKTTEWTEWSLDYPEAKSYRTIKTSKGYKWYYLNGGKKVYWNGGAYSVKQPSEKYTNWDKEAGSAQMYTYSDKTWRWYNGNRRSYTSYYSVAPKANMKKDEGLTKYTNWTKWQDVSYLTNANRGYRVQEEDTYSSYRIEYRWKSLAKLENYLNVDEFEKEVGMPLNEFLQKEKTEVDVIYKFKYRKK